VGNLMAANEEILMRPDFRRAFRQHRGDAAEHAADVHVDRRFHSSTFNSQGDSGISVVNQHR
jgi:hypothetical protein